LKVEWYKPTLLLPEAGNQAGTSRRAKLGKFGVMLVL